MNGWIEDCSANCDSKGPCPKKISPVQLISKKMGNSDGSCFILGEKEYADQFLTTVGMSWWLCIFSCITTSHCCVARTPWASISCPPPPVKASFSKVPLAASAPFQCFLLVCAIRRWGDRGQAWSLSMVLTDHPNNWLSSGPLSCQVFPNKCLTPLYPQPSLILDLGWSASTLCAFSTHGPRKLNPHLIRSDKGCSQLSVCQPCWCGEGADKSDGEVQTGQCLWRGAAWLHRGLFVGQS